MTIKLRDEDAILLLRSLTRDEITVLYYRLAGHPNRPWQELEIKNIALEAAMGESTVSGHFGSIFRKFGCTNKNPQQNWKCLKGKVNRLHEKVVHELLHNDPKELADWPEEGNLVDLSTIQWPEEPVKSKNQSLQNERNRSQQEIKELQERVKNEQQRLRVEEERLQQKDQELSEKAAAVNQRERKINQTEADYKKKVAEDREALAARAERLRLEKERFNQERLAWEQEKQHLAAAREQAKKQNNTVFSPFISFWERLRLLWRRWLTCLVFLLILGFAIRVVVMSIPVRPLSPAPTSLVAQTSTQTPPGATRMVFSPTGINVPAAIASRTVTPSNTPIPPTLIPSPSLTPETTLFFDDFDDGLSPQWKVLSPTDIPKFFSWSVVKGEIAPIPGGKISNIGKSSSGVVAFMTIGDESWQNYRVEFDIESLSIYDPSIDLMVRTQDLNHGVQLSAWHYGKTAWFKRNGDTGHGVEIPETVFRLECCQPYHIEVTVVGDIYQVAGQPEVLIPGYPSGGIVLGVYAGVSYDNFKVTRLP